MRHLTKREVTKGTKELLSPEGMAIYLDASRRDRTRAAQWGFVAGAVLAFFSVLIFT